jgi:putative heme iron utilization protein
MKKPSLPLTACTAVAIFANTALADQCATAEHRQTVAGYYKERPAAPPMIPARRYKLPEVAIAHALPQGQVYSTAATPEKVKQVWSTIDAWGAETMIHLVFTMGGQHVADFVSNVPITQPDDGSGFLDIYADGGAGVHGHIYLANVSTIVALDIPGADASERTRAISFYDSDGNAIVGAYATLGRKEFHQKAVGGFAKSIELVKSMPQVCK